MRAMRMFLGLIPASEIVPTQPAVGEREDVRRSLQPVVRLLLPVDAVSIEGAVVALVEVSQAAGPAEAIRVAVPHVKATGHRAPGLAREEWGLSLGPCSQIPHEFVVLIDEDNLVVDWLVGQFKAHDNDLFAWLN